ncbi:hypothetical protein [Mesorhizobium ventifaucium]|uniref:Uncharacterized protein n=1 Tax=Mesorhizobium ventifaucium TaxID=666020 RepID=A0ABN8JM74_9HYPH|nr:hypothetical protein [Mesorhizobium ventifaucium]CAH2399224.1 conserved hypothetical protein [Mesorhizobium ventifaucium]
MMTTPADLIADLDAALADAGTAVTIRRYTAPTGTPRPKTDIDNVPAAVRAVRAEELVEGIDQTASTIVVSPTALAALLPLKKGDKAVVDGRERNIELPKPISVQGVLVRIELLVSG